MTRIRVKPRPHQETGLGQHYALVMPLGSNIQVIKNAPSQIIGGFILILTLIILLLVLWINNLSENEVLMTEIVTESREAYQITKMLTAVHSQSMALQQLTKATKPEEKADAYLLFITHERTIKNQD